MPSSIGTATKSIFLQTEINKLTIEFVASGTLKPGQLVRLEAATGKVVAYLNTESPYIEAIGLCLHAAVDGQLVTVMVRGMAVIYGTNTSTTAITTYGHIIQGGAISGTAPFYQQFALLAQTLDATGIANKPQMMGWNLDNAPTAATAGQVMRILIKD